MHDLLNYLKNPLYNSSREPRIKYFLFLFFIFFLAALLFGIISKIICTQFHIEYILLSKVEINSLKLILVGIILAPISEEILFRSLLKFRKINIILFIPISILYISFYVYKSNINQAIVLSLLLFTFLFLVSYFPKSKIESLIANNFKYFFYGTSLGFGLIHLFNYSGNIYLILAFSFIIVGPQIVGGFILGFIRMNYGLFYSILFHMATNFFVIILMGHKL